MNDFSMQVPPGWTLRPLGEFAEIKLGKMLSAKAREPGLNQLPYLRNENVRWGTIDLSDVKTMGFKPNELQRYAVEPGDLMVCEGGEPGRAAVYAGPRGRYMFQKALHRVRVQPDAASAAFLRFFLEWHAGKLKTSQTTIAHFPLEKMEQLHVPLPSRPEQDRVVAEIEKQFTRLSTASDALDRTRARVKRYRSAVLSAAFDGRLVPRATTTEEDGAEVVRRVLDERRARWEANRRGTYKEPAEVERKSLPALPARWAWATAEQLSDATRAITYGVIKLGECVEGGVPTLRSSDVRHLRLDLEGVKRISPRISLNYARTVLNGGEVLVTVRGTLGGVVAVPSECKGFNVSREVAVLALVEPRLAKAVAVFIASPWAQAWLKREAKGIAYTGVNIEALKRLPVPVPPLGEQERIVAEVERRLSVCDKVQETVSSDFSRARALRLSILRAAFAGGLTRNMEK